MRAEYDQWYLGKGSLAERDRPGWNAEVDQLVDFIGRLAPAANTLDVACGSGFLTRHLSGVVAAIDQSPAMVAADPVSIAARRSFVVGDAFEPAVRRSDLRSDLDRAFLRPSCSDERRAFLEDGRRVPVN